MTEEQILLTILGEECNEIAQRASKAIRFGSTEIQPGQEFTNAERICYEFNDLYATMLLLREKGILPEIQNTTSIDSKKEKIERFNKYSEKLGILKR